MQLSGTMMTNALTTVNNERSQRRGRSSASFAFQSLRLRSPCLPILLLLQPHLSAHEEDQALIVRATEAEEEEEEDEEDMMGKIKREKKDKQKHWRGGKNVFCLLVLLRHQRNCDKMNLNLWLRIYVNTLLFNNQQHQTQIINPTSSAARLLCLHETRLTSETSRLSGTRSTPALVSEQPNIKTDQSVWN